MSTTVTITEQFRVSGALVDVTSVKFKNLNATAGIIRNDTGEVVVASGVALTRTSLGTYTYTFTEPATLGLTYTYYIEWVYNGITYNYERQVTGHTGTTGLTPQRDASEYIAWIKREFGQRQISVSDDVVKQQLENAIRYWNTHSAYKISAMYSYAATDARVQISEAFKTVVEVIPNATTTWIWNDHPLWTLAGVTLLDNVTSDLILMSEAFKLYRKYVGIEFYWTYEKSDDPAVGGYLYCKNIPAGCDKVFVVGTKRILKTEDINNEYILDWILSYTKALVKQVEGHNIRAADIVGIHTDGQQLYDEGAEEAKELKERLVVDGRWLAFARRT